MAALQRFRRELNLDVLWASGCVSAQSVSVSGLAAEDAVISILKIAGAGAGAVSGITPITTYYKNHGSGWLQLTTNTSGAHLLILYHDDAE